MLTNSEKTINYDTKKASIEKPFLYYILGNGISIVPQFTDSNYACAIGPPKFIGNTISSIFLIGP
jgi:hypothetical protein